MLYNRCTGIYKFENNTYPRRIRRRSNLGHIFRGKKGASYGPGNTVCSFETPSRRPNWKYRRTLTEAACEDVCILVVHKVQ